MRTSTAIRAGAWTALAAGVAAPLLRRRLRLRPAAVLAAAALAPPAAGILVPPGRKRGVAVCCLQMWAYFAGYEMPNDDPAQLEARVRIGYPVRIDRAIGLGRTPTIRLQRALGRPGQINRLEAVLVWSHWMWFIVPHGTIAYLLVFQRDRFPAGAARMYATFDLGLIGYWAIPTAPPWYAALKGYMDDGRTPELRRMMVEYGETFWGESWQRLYGVLGGNPLAAMPSLHFGTSVMAARLLSEVGPRHGAVGWTYALTLGTALVYLGEHYVIDLLAGFALAETVRGGAPRVAPAARALARGLHRLEARAGA